MLAKIVALFLVVVAVLAILGRLRPRLGRPRLPPRRAAELPRPRLCPACHRLLVTPEPCPCGEGPPSDRETRQG